MTRLISRRALLLMVVISGAYFASYFLFVSAARLEFMTGPGPWPLEPHYVVGGDCAKVLYSPIHLLDIWIRPSYWQLP